MTNPITADPRGSLWRRWDPHIHAPGTILNDQFGGSGSIDEYLGRIEAATPSLAAVGVTDYLTTTCYEAVAVAKHEGRLAEVGLVFPNIEMRLSIETKKSKGINLHLLVAPDDPDHVQQLHRFLRRLHFEYKGDKFCCTAEDLIRLGRAHSGSSADEAAALRSGVNQFKVDFRQLKAEFEDSEWMRTNALVAVAGGSNEGTAGLQSEDASFAATRKEIERFAHIIFSSSEQQARFWRGDGAASVAELEREYGGRKPCLHGSDAHCMADVGAPALDRLTWLKGDAVFDTLRQACLEPDGRVFIGAAPPELLTPGRTVSEVSTIGAPWLLASGIPVNPGLIAVIGARGSGKTALVDLVAHGAGNPGPLETRDSFLSRARALLGDAQVAVSWSNGDLSSRAATDSPASYDSEVHYLSQQFVEHLCSSEGASDELIEEIQRVVFAAHEPTTRLEATSFDELLDARVGNTRREREFLRQRLDRISEEVLAENQRRQALPAKQKALAQLRGRTNADKKLRDGIIKTGEKERAAFYERLRVAIEARERAIQAAEKQVQSLSHLAAAADRYQRSVFPDLVRQLKTEFAGLGLSDEEWAEFQIAFRGTPGDVVDRRKAETAKSVDALSSGDPRAPVTITSTENALKQAPLAELRKAFVQVADEIGIDKQNAQKLWVLNGRISASELEIEKAQADVTLCEGAEERLGALRNSRTECYREYFDLVIAEESILRDLYRPLESQLAKGPETVGRLKLVVVRHVDVEQWAMRGEELLDLRKTGTFKGRGALAAYAREALVPAWETGSSADVSEAMASFRSTYDVAIVAQSTAERSDPEGYQQWTLDVGRWLYSSDHIDVNYSFEYEGLPLSQLSPGTRGIVLLLLYLALDTEDARPLIIDQPEENLDPRSVFAELVALFKAARMRRQVIIVTHNANLVVNTDVDQVIVASCERPADGQPPCFSYKSGGLENSAIRGEVCEILEGGEAAFRERARRLRVSRF